VTVASGRRFAIAAPHFAAAEAGLSAVQLGGNAIDAALSAAAMLSVVYPHMTGIGGDLFALLVRPGGTTECINSSGAAPTSVDVQALRSVGLEMPVTGPHSITVPGAVAGWEVLSRSSRLGLEAALRPTVHAAERGVPVSRGLARALDASASQLESDEGMRETFFPNGRRLQEGDLLVQSTLSETLERIADEGAAALYKGSVGERLVTGLHRLDCPLATNDLERHEVDVGRALIGAYRDWEIATAPPNSQGFVLLQVLAVLERLGVEPDPLGKDGPVMASVFELCNGERDRYLCDPRVGSVDLERLLSEDHIEGLAAQAGRAVVERTPAHAQATGDTVAVVAADADGWAISLIQSLRHSFGAGILEPATGIICHNRGTSFSLREDSPNVLAPGKRPAHTLMPVVVRERNRVVATGTMGGRAQPQIHAQVLMRLLDGRQDPSHAVGAPRWAVGGQDEGMPGHPVFIEARARELVGTFEAAGLEVHMLADYDDESGHYQAVLFDGSSFIATTDPRCDGAALAG
jgi:gamma-glutamyltranspeptidase